MRYFDTAPLYGLGLSETRLNRFLRGKPRDDYVLSTKIGRLLKVTTPEQARRLRQMVRRPLPHANVSTTAYDGVMRSRSSSRLERLGLDRVDILYAHDLDVFNHGSEARVEERMDEFMAGGYKALLVACATRASSRPSAPG